MRISSRFVLLFNGIVNGIVKSIFLLRDSFIGFEEFVVKPR